MGLKDGQKTLRSISTVYSTKPDLTSATGGSSTELRRVSNFFSDIAKKGPVAN